MFEASLLDATQKKCGSHIKRQSFTSGPPGMDLQDYFSDFWLIQKEAASRKQVALKREQDQFLHELRFYVRWTRSLNKRYAQTESNPVWGKACVNRVEILDECEMRGSGVLARGGNECKKETIGSLFNRRSVCAADREQWAVAFEELKKVVFTTIKPSGGIPSAKPYKAFLVDLLQSFAVLQPDESKLWESKLWDLDENKPQALQNWRIYERADQQALQFAFLFMLWVSPSTSLGRIAFRLFPEDVILDVATVIQKESSFQFRLSLLQNAVNFDSRGLPLSRADSTKTKVGAFGIPASEMKTPKKAKTFAAAGSGLSKLGLLALLSSSLIVPTTAEAGGGEAVGRGGPGDLVVRSGPAEITVREMWQKGDLASLVPRSRDTLARQFAATEAFQSNVVSVRSNITAVSRTLENFAVSLSRAGVTLAEMREYVVSPLLEAVSSLEAVAFLSLRDRLVLERRPVDLAMQIRADAYEQLIERKNGAALFATDSLRNKWENMVVGPRVEGGPGASTSLISEALNLTFEAMQANILAETDPDRQMSMIETLIAVDLVSNWFILQATGVQINETSTEDRIYELLKEKPFIDLKNEAETTELFKKVIKIVPESLKARFSGRFMPFLRALERQRLALLAERGLEAVRAWKTAELTLQNDLIEGKQVLEAMEKLAKAARDRATASMILKVLSALGFLFLLPPYMLSRAWSSRGERPGLGESKVIRIPAPAAPASAPEPLPGDASSAILQKYHIDALKKFAVQAGLNLPTNLGKSILVKNITDRWSQMSPRFQTMWTWMALLAKNHTRPKANLLNELPRFDEFQPWPDPE